jgi:hypothetical protein
MAAMHIHVDIILYCENPQLVVAIEKDTTQQIQKRRIPSIARYTAPFKEKRFVSCLKRKFSYSVRFDFESLARTPTAHCN